MVETYPLQSYVSALLFIPEGEHYPASIPARNAELDYCEVCRSTMYILAVWLSFALQDMVNSVRCTPQPESRTGLSLSASDMALEDGESLKVVGQATSSKLQANLPAPLTSKVKSQLACA